MNIPKLLWHVWVGPRPAPIKWMGSWPEKHPGWTYTLIDNEYVAAKSFYNQHLIDEYLTMNRYDALAGAADLIRYEILYEFGGFMPGADSICLANTNELWTGPKDTAYMVFENEKIKPGFVTPVYAAAPGAPFLKFVIEELHRLTSKDLSSKATYMTTGNAYLPGAIQRSKLPVKVFPSHYFIPSHYTQPDVEYSGPDTVYCKQLWGSTKNIYDQGLK